MATIPELRKQLLIMADALSSIAVQIKQVEAELYRRPSTRVAPRSRRVSTKVASQIIFLKNQNPQWDYEEIAKAAKVNIGRVSEVLKGKRT